MAVLGPCLSVNMNGHNIHSQLTKSLERILEDAYLSGELKLSGRKLKDFPKPVKFDLSDTVVADLSKNRFAEVPDEVTTYVYLEKLFLSQNVLRCLPDAVGCLQSLTYLDLSSNQLTELPREICQMPLQMLLVSNNQLTNLPKDIGRMTALAELDASGNRLTQMPMSLGDCAGLRALHLANNQLGLLPLQITYLRLEHLDVSCNCISSLPLELRNMSTLVTLYLENNPLVSPPTTVCMRGRVHIFKYLEGMANKDTTLSNHRRVDETKRSTKHNSYIASSPNHTAHQITSGNATIDCLRHRPRHVVDSGYSTDGVDKRWCNDGGGEAGGGGSGRSTPSTPSTLSPGTALSRAHSLSSDSPLAPLTPLLSGLRISPEGNVSNGDDKSKVTHQQTYRQYKEALRQQRQQDIYKPRADQSSPDVDTSPQSQNQSPVHLQRNPQSSPHSPVANGYASNVSPSIYNRTLSSNSSVSSSNSTPNTSQVPNSPLLHSTPRRYQNFNQPQTNGNITSEAKPDEIQNRRPVQKVVPSRNVNKTYNTSPILNGNLDYQSRVNGTETYVKPTSPTKSPTSTLSSLSGNTRIARREPISGGEANGAKLLTTTVSYLKGASIKPPGGTGKLSWNKDAAPEKLSFTMKREFDKQKEESDLLQQLRTIIETRLKMNLPSDLAPVLADGVVLCHLANHVRPRSVASVHVPSPAQPKLTMARCRRNVDNFLDACRRIGVEEEDVCSPEDILSYHSDYEGERVRDTGPLANTLAALLAHVTPAKENRATFEQNNYHIQDANFVDSDSMIYHKQFRNRYTDDRSIGSFNYVDNTYTIDEAEEYEINENEYQNIHYSPVYNEGIRNRGYYQYNRVQFVTPFCQKDGVLKSESLEIYDTDEVDFHSVERNREVNYDRSRMNLEIQNNLNRELAVEVSALKEEENRVFYTCLCLGSFFISAIILFLYPL